MTKVFNLFWLIFDLILIGFSITVIYIHQVVRDRGFDVWLLVFILLLLSGVTSIIRLIKDKSRD